MAALAMLCRAVLIVAAGLLATAPIGPVHAAEVTGTDPGLDVSALTSRMVELETSSSFNEVQTGELLNLYRRSLTNLEQTQAEEREANRLAESGEKAPKELEAVRRSIELLQAKPDQVQPLPAAATAADLDTLLAARKAELLALETELGQLKERYAVQMGRPATARARLLEVRQQYDDTLEEFEAPAPADQLAAVTEATRWRLQSRAGRLAAERSKLDQELLTHQSRLALLDARQSLLALQVESAGSDVRQLEETISSLLASEAELAQQEAALVRDELENRHPLIRDLAFRGAELSDLLVARATGLESASAERDAVRRLSARIEEELSSTRSKLEIAGLNQAVGQLLVEQRRALPDLAALQERINQREKAIAELGLLQIHLVEEQRALRTLDSQAEQAIVDLRAAEANALREELATLAIRQRERLQTVIDAGAALTSSLGELDLAERQLAELVGRYDEFLARHLLWNRNTMPVKLDAFLNLPDELGRFLAPADWRQVYREITSALARAPMPGILLLVLLGLSLLRGRLLAIVDSCALHVGQIRVDSLAASMKALGATVLAAAPLPLVVFVLGGIIASGAGPAAFSSAVAASLQMVGVDLLILQVFFDACRKNGFAEKHCRWPADAAARMRFELGWLKIALPALRFVGEASYLLDTGGFVGALSALTLVGSAAALVVFIVRIFLPEGGVLRQFLAAERHSLLARLRPVWLGMLSAVLPLLIVLWLVGYNYGASALSVAFMHSLWLILALVMLQGLLVRWLVLGYRRLRLQAAIERRELARAEREAEKAGEEQAVGDEFMEVEEEEVDFAALGIDSRRLLNLILLFTGAMGLWLIWSEIMPALEVLSDTTLWSQTTMVGGESVITPVTLADLLLAVVVALVTVSAARGLPSFFEFVALQYTDMMAGERYTTTTLLRYAIYGVGVVSVFGILGGSWSQIQWLVAALGVGIGFGLQEIVANFISGLIILFERPIRVGDVVTVGETSGVVTRIKIRATTITDWDRKELLVPNREFITNRVLNWTLSDAITRVVIQAGVAYGSDVFQAMKLMGEAAAEHPNVLDDPAPLITFDGFGDNALNLTMRAYLPSMDNRVGTISDLYAALNIRFEDAGITIAFPQQDVHFGTKGPLEIRLQQPDSA